VKIKTITLSKDVSEEEYRVEKITDSIDYTPGSCLPELTVRGLCDAEDWKVITTKPPK
jgi:hypothetical protein